MTAQRVEIVLLEKDIEHVEAVSKRDAVVQALKRFHVDFDAWMVWY
jgi:hypothetical protein